MFLLLSVGASQSASSEHDAGRSPPSCLLGTASLGDDWWSCAKRCPGLPCCTSCWCLLLTGVTPASSQPSAMADTIFGSGTGQWVCPNDRQLALRAK